MYLFSFLAVINIFFVAIIIFFGRKNPASAWAWILVTISVPYFGFFLYLLIGLDSRRYRVFSAKSHDDNKSFQTLVEKDFPALSFIKRQRGFLSERTLITLDGDERFNDVAFLNFSDGRGAFTDKNSVKIYNDGPAKFEALLDDIKNARYFIHMLYYIIHDDELGRKIIAALTEKARQNLDVRLLVDGMGCWNVRKSFFAEFLAAGGKLAVFMPPHFMRVNFRNHRKIAVIDGIYGYVGGLNIGDEYVGKTKRFGFWRDTHLRICGDAVKSLEIRFILDWDFCAPKNKTGFQEKYFPEYINRCVSDDAQGVRIQIVSSGPDSKWNYIHYSFNKMINEAEKSVYIQTPYFSPDDSILESIRIAAISGADVRIVIPAKPDHPFVYWASLSYLGELLEAGVKCYKYEKGFLHGKTIMVDGNVSSVGTANMDVRSFKLNFEVNAFIYDRSITKVLEEKFLKDLNDCTQITIEQYTKRNAWVKTKEAVARLLSPLL
ncbi:MAG: cardiolipin synthase [Clostridiales bacterium]|jgi:cardiolipin synthase|nr:cardiolipin synthase [Clostridiales bacterium]